VKVFIDSNIPMYVAGREHPLREPAARFLAKVHKGEVAACTSTEVLQEILYRYASLGERGLAKRVYDLFVAMCPEVFPVTLADTDLARDLLLEVEHISARDAVHAAVMRNRGVKSIATFDVGFDKVPEIRRITLG
jgi:uncharacterized protein